MTDITEINTNYNLRTLIKDIEAVKTNPAGIITSVLEYLSNVTDGKVDIVDPTNPFVMLMESSAVNTAAAINESIFLLRKQYPILAQTEEDLYRHMSDKDYIDRFSSPSKATFEFIIQYNSLLKNAIPVAGEDYSKVTIARNTVFYANDVPFSIQYPIDINVYSSGNIVVTYDTSIKSPLQTLSTNIIPSGIYKAKDNTTCLVFSVDAYQFSIKSVSDAIDKSTPYNKTMVFEDKFYYCRVFYKTGRNLEWTEIPTTHTDQVYNPDQPTVVLKVMDKKLNVSIPMIYTYSNMLSGNLRIDIYTTKGDINLNMTDYNVKVFTTKLLAVDELRDINDYTLAMNKVDYYAYSHDTTSGGSNGISFKDLKARVINNSVGNPDIPITSVQLENSRIIKGFEITRNIDSVTNRIYVVSKDLPAPSNDKLITSASVTSMSFLTDLKFLKSVDGCYDNNTRVTISTDVIFKDNNGSLNIVSKSEINKLRELPSVNLADEINNNKYYYSPFHYVLDNTNGVFATRAYYLDKPTMSRLSFIDQNTSMQATVNTGSYTIVKLEDKYQIILVTSSDESYRNIPERALGVVMSFVPFGEKTPVYIKGEFIKTSNGELTAGEKVFLFNIDTNFDIDEHDNLYITNARLTSESTFTVQIPLKTTFTFFYCTCAIPVGIRPSKMDGEFPSNLYEDAEWLPITQETIEVDFGVRLKNLWSQTKSVVTGSSYETYKENIPMVYEEDVFEVNDDGTILKEDENGNLLYNLLHSKGDPVFDTDGNIVYLHTVGDLVRDENGEAIPLSDEYISRIIDIFLVDGAYYFTTDSNYTNYRNELNDTLVRWVTEDLDDINDNLLEQTHIYFRPKKSLGTVKVDVGSDEVDISSEQSLEITLYVSDSVYKDAELRAAIETKIIKTLNSMMNQTRIYNSDIVSNLKSICGTSVVTLSVKGLGGRNKNYEAIKLQDETERLCLRKRLDVLNDGLLAVSEDVSFNYIKYDVLN